MIGRLAERLDAPRPLWLNAALLVAAGLFGWVLCMRVLILSDEGYLLLQSWDMWQGRVIYREMDAFVTPGVWFLLAGVFGVFGPSIFVSRIVVFAAWIALLLVTERVVTRHGSRSGGLAAATAMLGFTAWAFPAWTFAFYSPFSVLFALVGLERLLAWWSSRDRRALFLCGLCLGLSIVFKQNYGVFALGGAMLGFGCMCLERRRQGRLEAAKVPLEVGVTAAGVTVAGLPVLAYLLATGAMPAAWQSLVVHPFEFAGAHDIPVAPFSKLFEAGIYTEAVERLTYLSFAQLNVAGIAPLQAFRGVQRMHVLLYWLPLPIFLGGALLAVRPRERRVDPVLATVTAVCGGVYLGLFPRADFNHLVNVYQVVIVAGAFVIQAAHRHLKGRSATGARVFAAGVTMLVAAYASIGLYWWNGLRERLSVEVGGARGGVKVSHIDAESLGYMVRAVESRTAPGEPLLTVPDLAMINFLTARPMPSAYYNLYEHHIAFDGGRAVVEGSETAGVRVALTRYDNFFSDRRGLVEYAPELTEYLDTRFRRAMLGGRDDYVLLEKRREPAPKRTWVDALSDCDIGAGSSQHAEVRRHLLFSALYHKSRENDPMPQEGRTTRCRIVVPEAGGALTFEVGYRQPREVTRGARLDARIAIDAAGQVTEVARERFRIATRTGSGPQMPYRKIEVDLSPWAGRSVDLVFHTRLDGGVRVHPLDYKGFAQVYRDVRLIEAEGTDAGR